MVTFNRDSPIVLILTYNEVDDLIELIESEISNILFYELIDTPDDNYFKSLIKLKSYFNEKLLEKNI